MAVARDHPEAFVEGHTLGPSPVIEIVTKGESTAGAVRKAVIAAEVGINTKRKRAENIGIDKKKRKRKDIKNIGADPHQDLALDFRFVNY